MINLRITLLNISSLLFVIIICGTLLLATFMNTNPKLLKAAREYEERKLLKIVFPYTFTNYILEDNIDVPADTTLGIKKGSKAYLGKQNQEIVAIILPITVKEGYGGEIKILVGISSEVEILGIKILSHNETTGLGDKIEPEKSDWLLGFIGRSLANTTYTGWNIKKDGGDFDQFTGATITPRAVITTLRNVLTYVENNQEVLFKK